MKTKEYIIKEDMIFNMIYHYRGIYLYPTLEDFTNEIVDMFETVCYGWNVPQSLIEKLSKKAWNQYEKEHQ